MKLKMPYWRIGLLACVMFLSGATATAARAQDAGPVALTRSLIDQTVAELKARREDLRGPRGTETGLSITTRLIAPHVDFDRLTRQALGVSTDKASPAQQAEIGAQFRTLLLHVTGKLLTGFNDEVLEVEPVSLAPDARETEIRIKVTATRNTGDEPPSPMYVRWGKGEAGWKIIDFQAEGVSVGKLYASNFAVVLARGDGLDNLIKLLQERNKLNAAQLAPAK